MGERIFTGAHLFNEISAVDNDLYMCFTCTMHLFRVWYHFGALLQIFSVLQATNYAYVMSGTLQVTHTSGTVGILILGY